MEKAKQKNLSDGFQESGPLQTRNTDKFVPWLASAIALFHIWANTFGNLSDLWRNCLHLGFLGLLGFLIYPGLKKRRLKKSLFKIDLLMGLLILSSSIYLILFEEALHQRNEAPVLSDLLFSH